AYASTPRGFVREQGRWWWRRRRRWRIFEQFLAADQIAKNGTGAFSYYRQRQVPRWARLVDYDPNPGGDKLWSNDIIGINGDSGSHSRRDCCHFDRLTHLRLGCPQRHIGHGNRDRLDLEKWNQHKDNSGDHMNYRCEENSERL